VLWNVLTILLVVLALAVLVVGFPGRKGAQAKKRMLDRRTHDHRSR
jgi:hypothetical protein